jgi:hypothetical protein
VTICQTLQSFHPDNFLVKLHVPGHSCCCSPGIALAAALMQLPWRVSGVMLAGSAQYYREQTAGLRSAFAQQFGVALDPAQVLPAAACLPLSPVCTLDMRQC